MKYYLIAGEKSGDLHAGNLIAALRMRDPAGVFKGFGGDRMREAGMDLSVHYRQMAFMGITQVLLNFRKIYRWMSLCRRDILEFRPDVVILVDYGGFNMRVARFCKRHGVRVFYYISPKVWAWNTGRARKLRETVDRMFCILPFEKEFFLKFGWEVDYVGNPVMDAVRSFVPAIITSPESDPVVALLPGSRKSELRRVLPLMAEVARNFPGTHFSVAALRELPADFYSPVEGLSNVDLVYDDAYGLLSRARAAVVTSGTATLETALFGVPQVVVYKASSLEYAIGSRVIKVRFISLVNLIADRLIVKEYLQGAATPEAVASELRMILEDATYRATMLDGYDEVKRNLGPGSASECAADLMTKYLAEG